MTSLEDGRVAVKAENDELKSSLAGKESQLSEAVEKLTSASNANVELQNKVERMKVEVTMKLENRFAASSPTNMPNKLERL
jgi:hypothetical protein